MATEGTPRSTGTSASAEFDRLLAEATAIAARIATALADGEWPEGLDWGHVGDMAETVRALPGGEGLYQRVDAYPGVRLDRDMGAGKGPSEWLAEASAFLEDDETEDAPPIATRAPHAPFIRSHGHDPRGPGADAREDARERDIERALALRAQGQSLHAIATATGRSKEWLRSHAGITDRPTSHE